MNYASSRKDTTRMMTLVDFIIQPINSSIIQQDSIAALCIAIAPTLNGSTGWIFFSVSHGRIDGHGQDLSHLESLFACLEASRVSRALDLCSLHPLERGEMEESRLSFLMALWDS